MEVSEPLRTQGWWHYDSYSVQGNTKLTSPEYKHTAMPSFVKGPYIILYVCVCVCLVRRSQVHFPEQQNVFLSHTYAASRS